MAISKMCFSSGPVLTFIQLLSHMLDILKGSYVLSSCMSMLSISYSNDRIDHLIYPILRIPVHLYASIARLIIRKTFPYTGLLWEIGQRDFFGLWPASTRQDLI